MADGIASLNTSKLGTKEYWNEFYSVEQNNFNDNSDDEGEIWFADADAEDKILDFLCEHACPGSDVNDDFPFSRKSSKMIDLGTGNGHLIFRLRSEGGFMGKLCGVDYAEVSVEFAEKILAHKKEIGDIEDPESISFRHVDIFNMETSENWDVVLDKGTLDAIALNNEPIRNGKTGLQLYPLAVRDSFVRVGGIILITSCNFTTRELIQIMSIEGLEVWATIEYPIYEFGGVKGQSVTSVAFKRTL
ncbi:methyltransferase domain-containing protein [Dipodascopsis uninucleata]